ncbi:hypothetical protein PR202_gb26478 [Eleusine coracana subsp. coracana]|uniref:Uncharacterized protein n=1 Tax=Eleusine coracana subsp. coracana TaxID=191504 RepID=A0AAV5FSP3_ELECO|nr:hypothetical protein PR202_gb26478 [Eleusine coracana subsp. coracana]
MALVSATASPASLHLSIASGAVGGAGTCSLPQLRRPLAAPLRAAKGANSTPVVLESKVKGKKKKGSGAGNLAGALDLEIKDALGYLDSDEQVFSVPTLQLSYRDQFSLLGNLWELGRIRSV